MDRPNILFILSDRQRARLLVEEQAPDAQVLTAWGRTVQPLHEDTLPVADAEDVVRC